MIRAVAVLSLVALLVLVLYVPSAHPPERFLDQLRSEHEAAMGFWGTEPAFAMLDRAMRMQSGAAQEESAPPKPTPETWNRICTAPSTPG